MCIKGYIEDDEENEEIEDLENRLLNEKLFNKNILRLLQSFDDDNLIISNFTGEFIHNMFIYSNDLTNEFNKILSNDAIVNNIIKNISLYDEEFFQTHNLNNIVSNYNFNKTIELIQNISNIEINKEIIH